MPQIVILPNSKKSCNSNYIKRQTRLVEKKPQDLQAEENAQIRNRGESLRCLTNPIPIAKVDHKKHKKRTNDFDPLLIRERPNKNNHYDPRYFSKTDSTLLLIYYGTNAK